MITGSMPVMARLLLLGLGAAFAVSCTEKIPSGTDAPSPEAVSFEAYVNRGVSTRAGLGGMMDVSVLQDAGFGVFGYHTGRYAYGPDERPDFMYNAMVSNPGGTAWDYTPVKYWPNPDDGDEGASNYVSFFAYAPYVSVDPSTGELSGSDAPSRHEGITRLSASIDAGNPHVSYKVCLSPSGSVDLCWGEPALDAQKPSVTGEKVRFNFRHALSSLNVQVDAMTDETDSDGTNEPEADTRIYVRSVTFEGFASRGRLNLGSSGSAAQWAGYVAGESLSRDAVTVHDGRLDGREATYEDDDETLPCLNPDLVQQGSYNARPGAGADLVNLFDSGLIADPVYVIPNGYPLKVTVEYDVETRDDKLAGSFLSDGITHGSSKRVAVSQSIVTTAGAIRLESGKKYVLRLHLGITSVKFGAEIAVTDAWSEDPHPADFYPVIMGQGYTVYDLDDNWVETSNT